MSGSPSAARLRERFGEPKAAASVLAGLAVFLVYRSTLLGGVGGWDTAEAQFAPAVLGTMHPTGFPAYTVVGWVASVLLTPFGEQAFRMNLLSAILAAVAAGAAVSILRRLAVPAVIAVAGAVGFALTPIAWAISAAADVHALHLALVALVTLVLVYWASLVDASVANPDDGRTAARADRALIAAAVLFGVAAANHGLTLLLVPPVGLYVLAVDRGVLRRPRIVLAAVGAAAGTTALLYLELPLRAGLLRAPYVYGHPETWAGFWEIVLARQFHTTFADIIADPGGLVRRTVDIWVAQLGLAASFVIPAFVVTIVRHPRYALLTGSAVVVTCVFAATYYNAEIGRYYLVPVLFGWTWIAIMAAAVTDRIAEHAGLDETAAATSRPLAAVALLLAATMLLPTALDLTMRWRQQDRSRETAMAGWLHDVFTVAEPDAVIVSWWSYSTTMWYGQLVLGERPDVRVVDDRTRLDENLGSVEDVIDANLGKRPVYVIRAQASDLQDLAARYAIEPVDRSGEVYRVTGYLEKSQP